MRAEELMIGDLVRVKKDVCIKRGATVRIHAIDGDNDFPEQGLKGCAGCIQVNDRSMSGGVWTEFLEPIPITAEILEKNGFKKHGFKDIVGQHEWSLWLDTLSFISLWCRELNDDPKDGWMIRIESPLATCCHKIEHVHEMQNTLRIFGINKDIKL